MSKKVADVSRCVVAGEEARLKFSDPVEAFELSHSWMSCETGFEQ